MRASVVARELGLSIYTVRRWLEGGAMQGIRIRRRWYTWRRVLDAVRVATSGV